MDHRPAIDSEVGLGSAAVEDPNIPATPLSAQSPGPQPDSMMVSVIGIAVHVNTEKDV